MNRTFLKIALLTATSLAGLIAIESMLGYTLWRKKSGEKSSIAYAAQKIYCHFNYLKCTVYNSGSGVKIEPKNYLQPDATTGFSLRPGTYKATTWNDKLQKSHSWSATIDPEGRRITSPSPQGNNQNPKVLVFGDSFTWGQANDDQTSFPFLLQSRLANHHVLNYAIPGAGNTHALLKLRELNNKNAKGISNIILFYGNYYNVRNIAAPSRMREFQFKTSDSAIKPFHPKAVLNKGKIEIIEQPFDSKSQEGDDPSIAKQAETTFAIFKEASDIARNLGARLTIAHHEGPEDDIVIDNLKANDFEVIDIRPSRDKLEFDTFEPLDLHPGPKTQNSYARKLAPLLLNNP